MKLKFYLDAKLTSFITCTLVIEMLDITQLVEFIL